MGVYSTNQARHLYVATGHVTGNIGNTAAVGTLSVGADAAKTHLYFEYKGHGGITRSDLIDVKNIMYAKAIRAKDMAYNPKAVIVELDNSVGIVGGQDYILRINFRQFAGMSDEDTYVKYGMVHATTGMSVSDFYKELATSLAKNFMRESTPLVNISLVDANDQYEPVLDKGVYTPAGTDTYKGVMIEEAEQPWVLGTLPQVPVYFDVFPTSIMVYGDEVIWGNVVDVAPNPQFAIHNGKKIADLEYFYMGERGDTYRGMGFPHTMQTKYVADASKAYDIIEIHYAYVGSNEASQKSEKDITIAILSSNSHGIANDIIGDINGIVPNLLQTLPQDSQ